MRPANFTRSIWPGVVAAAIAVPLLVVLSPLIVLIYLGRLAQALLINLTAWYVWRPNGKRVLLVYSDSVIWKEYFESDLLPRLHGKAVVLNWSHRKQWSPSVATMAFRHYGGRLEFNPLAIVFRPFRRAKVLRYYRPFKEYKHGRPQSVKELTDQLLELVEEGHVQDAV
jgi:hypothetical protein